MSHRNEWGLYHRKCDLTGKQIISMFSPDKPYTVYDQSDWWSDAYDPLAYGRDFDFSKPFFEQFRALNLAVPKLAIINAKSENAEYTNYSGEERNCYMVVGGWMSEDCYHSYRVFYCKDIVDCYDLYKCERCYECIECNNLHGCLYCHNCINSFDLVWCKNCIGCRNCYGCINLKNKEYCIFNVQYTKEEYQEKMKDIATHPDQADALFRKLQLSVPHQDLHVVNCERSQGDQLINCKNCKDCYTVKNAEDCRFLRIADGSKDCYDCNFCDHCELQVNCANLEQNYEAFCCSLLWYSKSCLYSMYCINSHHLFGCSGMKNNSYCILNKQYSEEEYNQLVPKIVTHMKTAGEWGKFFPIEDSIFGYNETVAHDYFPLSKKEVLGRGWKWHEEDEAAKGYMGPKIEVPSSIEDIDDTITTNILTCDITSKPYKIIPQELEFYRSMNIALPRKCPGQRHRERLARINPRQLFDRTCAQCQKEIRTTYAPDRPEIVYCKECFLTSVYG